MSSLPALTNISNGTAADATEVDGNFDKLAAFVDQQLINRDGSIAMTGELRLSSSVPSGPLVAASKGYVDGAGTQSRTAVFEMTTDIWSSDDDGVVAFDTESNDVDGWWSGASFTCPADGLYLFAIRSYESASSTANAQLSMQFSSDEAMDSFVVEGSHSNPASGSCALMVKAGESFDVAWNSTNPGFQVRVLNIQFSITKLAEFSLTM